jgi:hypothetical protein
MPVQNIQSRRIFQYTIFSQEGYSSLKYSARKDIPAQKSQSGGIFQYKIFSQEEYSCIQKVSQEGYSVPVQNSQSGGIF